MKTTIIALAISVLSLVTKAQPEKLTGCFGVSFGCTKQAVKEMMRLKHPTAVIAKDEAEFLAYKGGKFIDNEVSVWAFSFTSDNKFHTGSVSLVPVTEERIFDLYDDVSKNMALKYGDPKTELNNWKYPYSEDDKFKHGVTAIKVDKTYIAKMWELPSDDPNQPDLTNTILVQINQFVKVNIKYQNGILIEKAVKEAEKEKQGEM